MLPRFWSYIIVHCLTSFSSGGIYCWTADISLCVEYCDGDLVDSEWCEVVYQGGRGEALVESGSDCTIKQD